MALFTNYATLSYNGQTTTSNTVTGELLETISAAKNAVTDNYTAGSDVTYVVSLVNSGSTPVTGLTVTDDLGGYQFGTETVYPLSYNDGSLNYFVNGVLQPTPAVAAGPPLVVSSLSVPAGGSALLIYEATVTDFAPLSPGSTVVNTVTVAGDARLTPVTASATITVESAAELSVNKSLSPSTVAPDGQLTYTFVISNSGNTAVEADDDAVLDDTFDPILGDIAVTFNGTSWTEGVNYTYDETTGEFATLAGQITVPAAAYEQDDDGSWTVTPGTAELVITGTVQ